MKTSGKGLSMSTGTNDCPDRETILYESSRGDGGTATGAKLMLTDIMTEGEKRVHDILSDPDWVAWLTKDKPRSISQKITDLKYSLSMPDM